MEDGHLGAKWTSWLTSRRLRVHGLLLTVCLWTSYVWIFSCPGLIGRNGVLKGADFLHFYTLGSLALEHRGGELYDMAAQSTVAQRLVPQAGRLIFVPLYGPQISLFFAPLAALPYGQALLVWELFTAAIYALCCYAVWKKCLNLRTESATVLVLAAGYPAFFHLMIWGQSSAVALACFTIAYLELRAGKLFLAGLAIGCLAFKPQLGLAAAFVFMLSREWGVVMGAAAAGLAQLAAGWMYYGTAVMRDYVHHLLRVNNIYALLEPRPYHMHGLRSFWAMFLPWPNLAFGMYVVSALAVLLAALRCWKSEKPLGLRFGALLIATVLASPHLTVYDLVILAPAFLLLSDWALADSSSQKQQIVGLLLYLCYIMPLLGPVSKWTHVQLSVLAMAALLWILWRTAKQQIGARTPQATAVA